MLLPAEALVSALAHTTHVRARPGLCSLRLVLHRDLTHNGTGPASQKCPSACVSGPGRGGAAPLLAKAVNWEERCPPSHRPWLGVVKCRGLALGAGLRAVPRLSPWSSPTLL